MDRREREREASGASRPLVVAPPGRRRRRSRIAFGVAYALAALLTLLVIWPFRAPLFLAAVLASVAYGWNQRLVRRLRGRRKAAAFLSSMALLLVVVGPLAAAGAFVTGQVMRGLSFLQGELGVNGVDALKGPLPPQAQHVVDNVLGALHLSRAQLIDVIHRAATFAEGQATAILETSTRAVFHLAIMLVAFYFFLMEGRRVAAWLQRMSPLEPEQTQTLIQEFREVSRASIVGGVLSAVFQGAAAGLGYGMTGVPYPIFFGLLTLVASFLPVVGTMIVWLPAVVGLWLFGHHGASMALLSWSLVVVVGFEHVGKPVIMKRILGSDHEEMHTGVVFLALLGGIEMFGFIGLVLGPLVVAFFLAMSRVVERDLARGRGATTQ